MPSRVSLGEEARNRRLRRADWRFLLPNPWPGRTVCYADGALREAVEGISETMVTPDPRLSETCNLAVAVNPSPATLRSAFAALRPGGSCYTEWYSPFSGGLRRVRQRLEAAGFADVRAHWAWPLPSRSPALCWLPLDAPHALDYFLNSRPDHDGLLKGWLTRAQRGLWRASLKADLLRPVYVIARKPAPVAPAAPVPREGLVVASAGGSPLSPLTLAEAKPDRREEAGLDDLVREGWEEWGLGARPRDLAWLLLTGGRRSLNKPVALVFGDTERRPGLAVKMTRVPEAAPGLAHEAAVLRALAGGGGLPGVPRVLFDVQHGDQVAVGETALSGVPLWTRLRRANYRQLALQVTDWSIRLAHRSLALPQPDWRERLVQPVLDRFTAQFGSVVAPADLDETRRRLAVLDSVPLVCEQRDFSPWNVLVGPDGGLVVLDWESTELEGLPALDLLYCLSYLAFYLEGAMASGQTQAAYEASLSPTTFTGAVRVECLTRYCQALGLDPAALAPLRLLVWLLHAASEYQRLVSDAGGPPSRAALRGSLFRRLWQAELRHLRQGQA